MKRFVAKLSDFPSLEKLRQSRLCWGILVVFLVGCSHKSLSDFETPDNVVQNALSTALTAWQNGQPPGKIEGASRPTQVIDSHWENGDKLKSFEILGEEEPAAEGPSRWFSVKLTRPDGQEETVRYVLVGKESIWIYREDDFARVAGMEGGFPKTKPKRKK